MSDRVAPRVPLCYVAGPYSGVKNVEGGFPRNQQLENANAAVLLAQELHELGFACHVPHAFAWMRDELIQDDTDAVWDSELFLDEQVILRCDVMYRIPGVSAGADREEQWCNANGIPIIRDKTEAVQFLNMWKQGLAEEFTVEEWYGNEEANRIRFCNSFAQLCEGLGATAREKGFWDIHKERALEILRKKFFGSPYPVNDTDVDKPVDIGSAGATLYRGDIDELLQQIVQTLDEGELLDDPAIKLALAAGEFHEAIEALRKGDWESKDGVKFEMADAFIRLCDLIMKFGPRHGFTPYGFAETVYEKWARNKQRPRVHGKLF